MFKSSIYKINIKEILFSYLTIFLVPFPKTLRKVIPISIKERIFHKIYETREVNSIDELKNISNCANLVGMAREINSPGIKWRSGDRTSID